MLWHIAKIQPETISAAQDGVPRVFYGDCPLTSGKPVCLTVPNDDQYGRIYI
jgi:hypothetical protein